MGVSGKGLPMYRVVHKSPPVECLTAEGGGGPPPVHENVSLPTPMTRHSHIHGMPPKTSIFNIYTFNMNPIRKQLVHLCIADEM